MYVCIDYDIIYHHQINICIKLRWDVENNLSLKNVVVSFQTIKTAIWRSCGTEKEHADRSDSTLITSPFITQLAETGLIMELQCSSMG